MNFRRRERFKFGAADGEAIIKELGSIDWHGIFSRKNVDKCIDLFYDVISSCFGSFVPKTSPHCVQKFRWDTKDYYLDSLLGPMTAKVCRAPGHEGAEWFEEQGNKSCKNDEKSERRCMIDDDIDSCDCEQLRDEFTALRTEYQEHHGRINDYYHIGIEEAIKTDPRSFFLICRSILYPSVMSFEDRLGSQGICDLLAESIERTYVDESWVPSNPGPDLVNDELPFGSLQFTVSLIENELLELDSSKGPGPDGVPPLILKNGASGFVLPLLMIFNGSLATCIFSNIWKLSFVTSIFKSG
jgi:hypothetical protein